MNEATTPPGARRSVASMQILANLASEHGLDLRDCLLGTGLRPDDLADPTTFVAADQELALIRNLVRHLGEVPALGLRAGLRYHFTALGAVGLAFASSPTLESAMTVALRYIDLTFALTHVDLERAPGECRIVLSADGTPDELVPFALERSVGVLFSLARDLFGDVMLCKHLAFALPPPSREALAVQQELLGITPRYGATRTEVVLDAAELARPLAQASPVTLHLAESECRRLMLERRARTGFAERVRDRIARHGGRPPDMEAVADELHVTPRTLRRRLKDEGTSYSALCNEVRETYSEELLAVADLSVAEIADRLGYADATSFIAAFKRWKGETPHRFRQSLSRRG